MSKVRRAARPAQPPEDPLERALRRANAAKVSTLRANLERVAASRYAVGDPEAGRLAEHFAAGLGGAA